MPVRDIPKARTSMGTVRVHFRRSMFRSGRKSSGCFSSRVCIRDMMDMYVISACLPTNTSNFRAGIKGFIGPTQPPLSPSLLYQRPTRTSLDSTQRRSCTSQRSHPSMKLVARYLLLGISLSTNNCGPSRPGPSGVRLSGLQVSTAASERWVRDPGVSPCRY